MDGGRQMLSKVNELLPIFREVNLKVNLSLLRKRDLRVNKPEKVCFVLFCGWS